MSEPRRTREEILNDARARIRAWDLLSDPADPRIAFRELLRRLSEEILELEAKTTSPYGVVRITYVDEVATTVTRLCRAPGSRASEVIVKISVVERVGPTTIHPEMRVPFPEGSALVSQAFADGAKVECEFPVTLVPVGALPEGWTLFLRHLLQAMTKPIDRAEAMLTLAGNDPPW